jgi:pSer/pThr/pTyr-binding forkhead associated (FHA) protein
MRMVLGAAAVARGVLLGRDHRCDGSERAVLATPSISRVHALVIELAGKLYVVDAGSTNGVWQGHHRVPFARLVTGEPVALSGTVATLVWGYSH